MTEAEEENQGSSELIEIRKQIASIDTELARLVCRRLELAKIAGEMKHTYGRPIRDPEVEKQNLERVLNLFKEYDQKEEAAEAIWKEIMKWSLDVQTEWF
jgi:chorismate mutase